MAASTTISFSAARTIYQMKTKFGTESLSILTEKVCLNQYHIRRKKLSL